MDAALHIPASPIHLRNSAGIVKMVIACVALLAVIIFLVGRVNDPKRHSEQISGVKLPPRSELILTGEDFGYTVYVWKLDSSFLGTLQPPREHSEPQGEFSRWTLFDPGQIDTTLPPSGILPPGSEKIVYKNSVHHVRLERNLQHGILKISGFDPN